MLREWKRSFVVSPEHRARGLLKLKIIAVLVPMIAVVRAVGCGEPPTVELLPSWKPGETTRYDFVKTQWHRSGLVEKTAPDIRAVVEIEVVEAYKNGHLIRWRKTTAKTDGPTTTTARSASDRLAAGFDGVDCLIELDRDSRPHVRNWEDVRRHGRETLSAMRKAAREAAANPDDTAILFAQMEAVLADRSQIEQVVLADAELWFHLLGRTYSAEKPIAIDTKHLSPFSMPLPSIDTLTLKSDPNDPAVVVIDWRRAINVLLATEALEKRMQELSERSGTPVPPHSRTAVPTLEMNGTATIDRKACRLSQLSLKTTKTIGLEILEETVEIKLQPMEGAVP